MVGWYTHLWIYSELWDPQFSQDTRINVYHYFERGIVRTIARELSKRIWRKLVDSKDAESTRLD